MLSAAITAVTHDRSSGSPVTIAPVTSLNRPCTVVTPRWRTVKLTSELTGLIVQVPARYPGSAAVDTFINYSSWLVSRRYRRRSRFRFARASTALTDPDPQRGPMTDLDTLTACFETHRTH